ncbi:MAG: alpha-ketoacid dehydrogenase subunit alpha/beta [Candidatus Poseidoniales archaeon]|jgi:2-oxoisovalerate dehydrogenase E1 component
MAIARQGIWLCPECGSHEVWKTRESNTNQIDRKCNDCDKRARVTLDRSETGKGRKRNFKIWERDLSIDFKDIIEEAKRRNNKIHIDLNSEKIMPSKTNNKPSQSELPPIWGAKWTPTKALLFTQKIEEREVKKELLRFVAERHDGYLEFISRKWTDQKPPPTFNGTVYHEFTKEFCKTISYSLRERLLTPDLAIIGDEEVIPRRNSELYLGRRNVRFLRDIALCLRRIAYASSIDLKTHLQWQRWMTRTREMDEHLKDLFMNGISTPDGGKFGGKGFRSTWQEGIVACATPLRRAIDTPIGEKHHADIIAPMIRDTGLALAVGQTPLEIFAAQMGKSGSYMSGGNVDSGGRDLHIGNWEKGVLPPTAPLPIASATATGVALAASLLNINRFHLAPVGEGTSSNGEFWEAMNLAGARGLPIAFMIQNNQIALDTFTVGQSGAETFGDKGHAMGIPSWSIDGSNPSQFYASTATAREYALDGGGPTLIHVETMRGCGHAHHHDDLYLGSASGNPPGYVGRDLLTYWAEKDPLPTHRQQCILLGASEKQLMKMEKEEQYLVENARKEMELMPWPEGNTVTQGITSRHNADSHSQQYERFENESTNIVPSPVKNGELKIKFSNASNSSTYSRAIQNAMVVLAEKYGEKIVFMGEDMEVAGAFGMNIPLKAKGHSEKLLDMPLSESIIIHSATGAALGGMRPVAEIQFGGFAALAMNALVNNAAQLRWRWGAEVPLTVRIPLGAKTRSGPFHANMIESWFINDPGLTIVFPSNPQDAYDLLIESHDLNDPVIFLEHLGLYGLGGGKTGWGDSINQIIDTESVKNRLENNESSIGKAKIIRGGNNLTIITWGAMVHVALKAATILSNEDIEVEIIDLRTILPFDSKTCIESVMRTKKMIVLQESQYTGGLGHTVSSRVIEETFWNMESPPVVIGALDTPVPFSPTLEDYTIPTVELVLRHVRRMCK